MENRYLKIIGFWAMALILFVATFIVIGWAISFASWASLDSGWAQAIGSLIGIGIAIWVPYKQRRDSENAQKDAERAEERRILSCIFDEFDHVDDLFRNGGVQSAINGTAAEPYFNFEVTMPSPMIPVCTAYLDRLDKVQNRVIRHHIIRAYSAVMGFAEALKDNNRVLADLKNARTRNAELFNNARDPVQWREADAAITAKRLREAFPFLQHELRTVIRVINDELLTN